MGINLVESILNQQVFNFGNESVGGNNSLGDFDILQEVITQPTHGFGVNEVISHNGSEFIYADVRLDSVVLGIITEVIDNDTFRLGKLGYVQNNDLITLLNTAESDNLLYLGFDGALVPLTHSSIEPFSKTPILKKIELDKGEIVRSTQFTGYKDESFVNITYIGGPSIEEGTWKIEKDDVLLKFYRFENNFWVLKTTFGASVVSDTFVLENSAGQVSFIRPNTTDRRTLLKPSIDGFGAVLGNPQGRTAMISKGECAVVYPNTEMPVWVTDNPGNGTYSPMTTYLEEDNTITSDQIMYSIRIWSQNFTPKFRFALLKAEDDSILLQNLTQSEYDLDVNTEPLLVGLNTIVLKYPIAFTKGLDVKVSLWTPTPVSIELGSDGKSANSIFRQFTTFGTIEHTGKWRSGFDFEEDQVIAIEAIDSLYDISKIGKYKCLVDHTATDFMTDLNTGKWEYINPYGYTNQELKNKYEANSNTNAFTDAEKSKLAGLDHGKYLGVYADLSALQSTHPVGINGDIATVTNPNGNLFYWDEVAWADTGTGFVGNMLKVVYDPTAKNVNAFSMDNMDETITKKIFTDTERSKLTGIEPGAEVNNISDIYAANLTDGVDSVLHYHSSDRNRSNHTGTQAAITISDFDLAVSGNTTVLNNTMKLNTIQFGAEVNVQSDWLQTDSSVDDYVKNKPDSFVTVSSSDTTSGHLENKLSNSGSVKFTKLNAGANEEVKADFDLNTKPRASGFFQTSITNCQSENSWYKVSTSFMAPSVLNFTYDSVNDRLIYTGSDVIDFYILGTFTGSHSDGSNRECGWEIRINGSSLPFPPKYAIIEKNKSMSVTLLIPTVYFSNGDYVELFCNIDKDNEDIITENMNFTIRT